MNSGPTHRHLFLMPETEGKLTDLDVAKWIAGKLPGQPAVAEVQPSVMRHGMVDAFGPEGAYLFTFDRAAMRFHVYHDCSGPITESDVTTTR